MQKKPGHKIQVTLDDDTLKALDSTIGGSLADKARIAIASYLNEKSFTKFLRSRGQFIPEDQKIKKKKS